MGGFNAMQEENIAAYGGGGGYGGFGSSWLIIIVFFVIAWLLFRDGHRDGVDGHRDGVSHWGDGCGPCVRPSFIDESNYEEERNIDKKLCCIEKEVWETDRDVWKTACETQKEVHCEGEKTRDLIRCEAEKDLRDKLEECRAEKLELKNMLFTEKKFDQVLSAIGHTDRKIEHLECEVPKRQPVWAECVTPITRDVDVDRFPRRGRCDECYSY